MLKRVRVLMIVATALFVFSGAANALDAAIKKVDVDVDGKISAINTTKKTVGEVLADLSITVEKDDIVQPALSSEVKDNMIVKINRAYMITVNIDGTPRYLRVNKGQIGSVKEKMEELLKTKTTLVGAKETDPLSPKMTIELVTSYTERDEEKAEIPFEVVYVENDQADEGTETVLTEGASGISVTVYESRYEGGELIARLPVETKVEKEKVDKVIEKGTKPLKPVVPVSPEKPLVSKAAPGEGNKLYYTKVLTLRASAYTSDRGDAGTHTFTGERARVGLVAVDPKFIPLGTMLYVEGYGICRAADTGGLIKGDAIDLFFDTYEECVNFGRRNVTVYVLEASSDEILVQDLSKAVELEKAA